MESYINNETNSDTETQENNIQLDLNIDKDKDNDNETINCKKKDCEHIEGNIVEIDVKKDDCEIKADIEVDRKKTVRLWGQVKDCRGIPVNCALVKLVKKINVCGKPHLKGLAHTVTDCKGFYQFDICTPVHQEKFFIIVGKPAIGEERTINNPKCNPCKDKCECIKY